jgi:hypothetical protein
MCYFPFSSRRGILPETKLNLDMVSIRKWLLAGFVLVATVFIALIISVELFHRNGPPAKDREAREAMLKPLLKLHADQNQVVQALGLKFIDYSVGSTNRADLETWFSHEPTNMYVHVRENMVRYPSVFYQTTRWTMVWLFFDSEGKLQDYYLCEQ